MPKSEKMIRVRYIEKPYINLEYVSFFPDRASLVRALKNTQNPNIEVLAIEEVNILDCIKEAAKFADS